ncbi:MAG: tetratricopeptide repeat protein, partial [Chromatiales bacterium]
APRIAGIGNAGGVDGTWARVTGYRNQCNRGRDSAHRGGSPCGHAAAFTGKRDAPDRTRPEFGGGGGGGPTGAGQSRSFSISRPGGASLAARSAESPPQVALAAPSVTRPTAVVTRPPEEPLGAPTVPKETMVALSPSPLDASVMPGEIRITRARPQDVPLSQLQEAYQAYQRGDYNRAETLYRTVLARNPQSRDALLGVAALAWRSGDRAAAAGIYDRVLRLDPSDSAARSALLMLNRNPNPVADESTLKLMLAREPDSPQLRFSLGNIYARQSRWSEAHKAYFDALARDKNNPDYAFNLAVSLDHLGQSAPALDYYRKAVQLAATRPPRFASAQANSRIQALAAASGSPP